MSESRSLVSNESRKWLEELYKDTNFSPVTKHNRLLYLQRLNLLPDTYEEILLFPHEVITGNTPESRVAMLFHVISFLKQLPSSDINSKLLVKYYELVTQDKALIREEREDNKSKVHERQLPLEFLQNKLTEWVPNFDYYMSMALSKSKVERASLYDRYQMLTMLSYYVDTPAVRNDYNNLIIVDKESDTNDTDNFVVVTPRKIFVILNKYKTSKVYGKVRINLRPRSIELTRNLLRFRKALNLKYVDGNTVDYLFNTVISRGLKMFRSYNVASQKITLLATEIFGQKQTINNFRHSWETSIQHDPSYADMTIRERKKTHQELLHNMNTALLYNRV